MLWTRREKQLDSELREYLEAETVANLERGMSPDEAKFAARRKLGNITRIKENTREIWGFLFLDQLWQDIVFGVRLMKSAPILTTVAVLSLGLGIGANTAIFSFVDRLLVRELPIGQPHELVSLERVSATGSNESLSIQNYDFLRTHVTSLSGIAAVSPFSWQAEKKIGGGGTQTGLYVSGNFFAVLGLKPAAGRLIMPLDDNEATDGPVAVLDYTYWKSAFNADAKVIGTILKINREPFRIAGVAPAEFFGLSVDYRPKIYVPARLQPRVEEGKDFVSKRQNMTMYWLSLAGRLRPGISTKQAELELSQLLDNFNKENGLKDKESIRLISCARGLSDLRIKYSRPLQFLMASTILVLLIACMNIANLLLERAASRRKEIGMRFALGANRWRIGRQLLTEALMISLMGGTLAIALYYWAGVAIQAWLELGLESSGSILDIRLLLFNYALAFAATILFSLAPIAVAQGTSRPSGRAGRTLAVLETALSLVLLVGAMLFFSSLKNLKNTPTGFKAANAIQVQLNPSWGIGKPVDFAQIEDQLARTPNVVAAGFASRGLLQASNSKIAGFRNQRFSPTSSDDGVFDFASVTNGYFEAAGIPLLSGRVFHSKDAKANEFSVAILNQTMARRYWGALNPVGSHFGFGPPEEKMKIEVVGVVGDAKYGSLREPSAAMAYFPYNKESFPMYSAVVRLGPGGSNAATNAEIRRIVEAARPHLFLSSTTLEELLDDSLDRETVLSVLSGVFGIVALLLAGMGIYGVISYGVTRRTPEMGLRIALGAMPGQILWMMLRESMGLAVVGVALGVPGALLLRLMAMSLLYGIEPSANFLLMAGGAAILLAAAILAGLAPAFRASRIEPLSALRCD